MGKIRIIKPDFYVSDQVVNCSLLARYLFIGMWVFADDNGVIPDSAKRLKSLVLPGDDIPIKEIFKAVEELILAKLVEKYEVNFNSYLRITGFKKHQYIQRPHYKYPLSNMDESNFLHSLNTAKTNTMHSPSCVGNGNGNNNGNNNKNGNGNGNVNLQPTSTTISNISFLWNELLPELPKVERISDKRSHKMSHIIELVKKENNYQNDDEIKRFFREFFISIKKSDFLMGRSSSDGKKFNTTIDFVFDEDHFMKIIEGSYH